MCCTLMSSKAANVSILSLCGINGRINIQIVKRIFTYLRIGWICHFDSWDFFFYGFSFALQLNSTGKSDSGRLRERRRHIRILQCLTSTIHKKISCAVAYMHYVRTNTVFFKTKWLIMILWCNFDIFFGYLHFLVKSYLNKLKTL